MTNFTDLTVVDLTRILSGPYCTMYFADLGANVIKVEPPLGDDTRYWGPPFVGTESSYFLSVNRNKRSIVLDLKTEVGKSALRKLVAGADIVVENFRPGTLSKLGFDFEQLKEIRPNIILASISGFGQTGCYKDEPGYDIIAQGMGGFMSVTGTIGGPPIKGGFSLADLGTGMWAIIGILTALYNRDKANEPQWVDVSLLETMISWQTYLAGNYFASGNNPVPLGNAHPNICPYQAFSAQDGYFILAIGNEGLWRNFCASIDNPDWLTEERFMTNAERVRNRESLVPLLETLFRMKSVEHWVALFRGFKIPCGPINRISDIFADSYVLERNMLFTIQHTTAGKIQQVGTPVKFLQDCEPGTTMKAPPLLNQHYEEVLQEFGFSDEEIAQLKLYTSNREASLS